MALKYNPKLKKLARSLRNNSTQSEILLWRKLKSENIFEYDFHRQKPIGEYIVDFYCSPLQLVIEIDGESHADKQESDKIRQDFLESIGLTVIRFWDWDVKDNMEGVLTVLSEWLKKKDTHP